MPEYIWVAIGALIYAAVELLKAYRDKVSHETTMAKLDNNTRITQAAATQATMAKLEAKSAAAAAATAAEVNAAKVEEVKQVVKNALNGGARHE